VRVFVDTNVLLDVLAAREPFYPAAARIWTLAEAGRLEAFVSAVSFTNCYYLVHRHAGRAAAARAVRLLRGVFAPVDLTASLLDEAMGAGFADFEDAVQYFSAVRARAACLVTRNVRHFPRRGLLPVLSPPAFLAAHASGERGSPS